MLLVLAARRHDEGHRRGGRQVRERKRQELVRRCAARFRRVVEQRASRPLSMALIQVATSLVCRPHKFVLFRFERRATTSIGFQPHPVRRINVNVDLFTIVEKRLSTRYGVQHNLYHDHVCYMYAGEPYD
jgi:hypothetical protein